jgi:hypothetical protein
LDSKTDIDRYRSKDPCHRKLLENPAKIQSDSCYSKLALG